jgi:hypothetical protein
VEGVAAVDGSAAAGRCRRWAVHDLGRYFQQRYPAQRAIRPVAVSAALSAGLLYWGARRLAARAAAVQQWPLPQATTVPATLATSYALTAVGSGLTRGYVFTRTALESYFGPGPTKRLVARLANAGVWAGAATGAYNAGVAYVGRANEKVEPGYVRVRHRRPRGVRVLSEGWACAVPALAHPIVARELIGGPGRAALGAGLHWRLLMMQHRRSVADQFPVSRGRAATGRNCAVSDCWVTTRASVSARCLPRRSSYEVHDESEQHGKPVASTPEPAGGAVALVERAPAQGASANEGERVGSLRLRPRLRPR